MLLRHVLAYAEARGVKRVIGHILRENRRMIELSKRLGFAPQAGRSGGSDVTMVKQIDRIVESD